MSIEQRQFDVFQGGRARKEMEVLKDKTNLGVAYVRQFFGVQIRHIHSLEQITTVRGAIQAAQDVHQRGFSRAAGPHERDELASFYFQGDIIQGLDGQFARVVHLGNPFQLDDRAHGLIGRFADTALAAGVWRVALISD